MIDHRVMRTPLASSSFFAFAPLVLLQYACGSAAPRVSAPVDAAVATQPLRPSDAALPPEPVASSIIAVPLACGRASAALPATFTITLEQTRVCVDPGYPEDVRGQGFAGGRSVHVLQRGTCKLKVSASERTPKPAQSADAPISPSADDASDVVSVTPEGSQLLVQVTASAACANERAEAVASIAQSVRVLPLRDSVVSVQATISSVGHTLGLDVPAGVYVVSVGGMADQYETAYQLRGAKGAWATLYTSWRGKPSASAGQQTSTLLGQHPRWRTPFTDYATDTEGCRVTTGSAPDKQLKLELVMCGSRDGFTELEELLRSARIAPSEAGSNDAPK